VEQEDVEEEEVEQEDVEEEVETLNEEGIDQGSGGSGRVEEEESSYSGGSVEEEEEEELGSASLDESFEEKTPSASEDGEELDSSLDGSQGSALKQRSAPEVLVWPAVVGQVDQQHTKKLTKNLNNNTK
jgi:hypothetical protein